jgi:uncharacterized protein (DUF1697 family)
MTRYVALLRGINVSGHNKVPMAELRALCTELGWKDVQTYIQSGNVVFSAEGGNKELEAQLEQAVAKRFGFTVAVMIRSAAEWSHYVAANPLPEASAAEPNRVMLSVAKEQSTEEDAAALQERARDGEQVRAAGGALWIYFPGGSGRSRLFSGGERGAPPATTRNWRTVLQIQEMLRPPSTSSRT